MRRSRQFVDGHIFYSSVMLVAPSIPSKRVIDRKSTRFFFLLNRFSYVIRVLFVWTAQARAWQVREIWYCRACLRKRHHIKFMLERMKEGQALTPLPVRFQDHTKAVTYLYVRVHKSDADSLQGFTLFVCGLPVLKHALEAALEVLFSAFGDVQIVLHPSKVLLTLFWSSISHTNITHS